MIMRKHLDLFSGIGGFALAAQANGYNTIAFCEIDKYCQEVLRLRFRGVPIYDDIRTLSAKRLIADANSNGFSGWNQEVNTTETREQAQRLAARRCKVDLLTGGFPCQPFSQAGKRRGKEDDRYLWPELLRVISDVHPTWCVLENVRGILAIENGMVFEQVCAEMEALGYEVQTFVIPACAVNAPHRRDRVWFIAHARCEYGERTAEQGEHAEQIRPEDAVESQRSTVSDESRIVADPDSTGIRTSSSNINGNRSKDFPESEQSQLEYSRHNQVVTNNNKGLQRLKEAGNAEEIRSLTKQRLRVNAEGWNQYWLEVATRLCRVDDGLPAGMDGFKLSKAGHRVARLKALGNAIVPQVAYEIIKAIKESA